jgi:hypothetical protein
MGERELVDAHVHLWKACLGKRTSSGSGAVRSTCECI